MELLLLLVLGMRTEHAMVRVVVVRAEVVRMLRDRLVHHDVYAWDAAMRMGWRVSPIISELPSREPKSRGSDG